MTIDLHGESPPLPCPFCGGTTIHTFGPTCNRTSKYDPADRAFPIVRCGECYAEAAGTNWDDTCRTAVEAWNRRQLLADNEARIRADERGKWQPIETAPHETLVVLGWYESDIFKQEIALASAGRRYPGGASDMWWHGRATHWMPLPPAPDEDTPK